MVACDNKALHLLSGGETVSARVGSLARLAQTHRKQVEHVWSWPAALAAQGGHMAAVASLGISGISTSAQSWHADPLAVSLPHLFKPWLLMHLF